MEKFIMMTKNRNERRIFFQIFPYHDATRGDVGSVIGMHNSSKVPVVDASDNSKEDVA
jgi:hypothetical protein